MSAISEDDFAAGMHYSYSRGRPGLRQKIAAHYAEAFSAIIDPEKEILISAGSKPILFMVMLAAVEAGDMSLWHSSTLHGTQPQIDDASRISLRILVERNQSRANGRWLDQANKLVDGPLQLDNIRNDFDENGVPIVSSNQINSLPL